MIDSTKAGKLNNMLPDAQVAQIGTELKYESDYGLYALYCPITADATSGKSVTVPFACEIVDVVVQARATSGSGTAKVRTGTSDITNAIVMATDTNITRAGTIDDTYSTLAAGASLNVITNGANDRGLVKINVRRL